MKENIKKIQKAFDLLIEADKLIGDAKYALMNSGYVITLDTKMDMRAARNSLVDPIMELNKILLYEQSKQKQNKENK